MRGKVPHRQFRAAGYFSGISSRSRESA